MPDGKMKTELVHRLVALVFCEKKEGKTDVNHIDGNKSNNTSSNLEWVDKFENMQHAVATGLQTKSIEAASKAAKIANSYKITVLKNGEVIGVFTGQQEAAKSLGICVHTIRNTIRLGRPTQQGLSFVMERGGDANAVEN